MMSISSEHNYYHMRTAALICEFNPFHNGHAYILRKLREEYNADFILAIMSGNYVQRGEPAIFDKYVRAKAALKGDGDKGYADVVIELPTLFSTASAGDFAAAGVLTALRSGVVDILGFGTEDGVSIEEVSRHALLRERIEKEAGLGSDCKISQSGGTNSCSDTCLDADSDPDTDIDVSLSLDLATASDNDIRVMLSAGHSYPEALAARLKALGGEDYSFAPNNILAVEYLRALDRYDKEHSIEAVAVPRVGDAYSSTTASDGRYCSAAAIRRKMSERDRLGSAGTAYYRGMDRYDDHFFSTYMPEHTYMDELTPVSPELYASLLSKALLDAKYRGLELTQYADVSREIADRLIKCADIPMGYRERIEAVKTRQYTYTRISRALLHIALGITRAEAAQAKADGYCAYIRLLGFRQEAAPLLKRIKDCAKVPVISKTADYAGLLHSEIYYSGLYYALSGGRSEYERSPIVL